MHVPLFIDSKYAMVIREGGSGISSLPLESSSSPEESIEMAESSALAGSSKIAFGDVLNLNPWSQAFKKTICLKDLNSERRVRDGTTFQKEKGRPH